MARWPLHELLASAAKLRAVGATSGSSISREFLQSEGENTSLNLSPQLRSFYLFHVYFSIRRILYETGGIQSISTLPGDPTFNDKDNPYDEVAYRRIWAEFDVDPISDFRFTFGQNHGLGYVFINYPNGDYAQKKWVYPPATLSNPSSQRFADEGGTDEKGNKLEYIRNDQGAERRSSILYPIPRKDSPKAAYHD